MPYQSEASTTKGFPKGIPYIIGNEAAERFSFYGMKAAMFVFMTQYLHLMGTRATDALTPAQASANQHWFVTAVYLTPLLGAFISDRYWGKYTTIIWLSLVYCAGHLALAYMGISGPPQWWFIAGLGLIAIGSGGIKPCVSAHVGDQFGPNNQHLIPKIFNWFYFSINLGAALSNLLIPWILLWYGPHWAFGIPGILMILATVVFWLGRYHYVHIPAAGPTFTEQLFSKEGARTILRLCSIFLFIPIFWTLFDQTASSWVYQAIDMDRELFGIEILPSQVQAANPFLILILIPLFTYVIYPLVEKVIPLTPLRKIGFGLFLTAFSFCLSALIQTWIDAGQAPSIAWQLLAYLVLTSGEIMVSIVCLEFAYTQAPKSMKSIVMALFLASVALGNGIAALVNTAIQIPNPLAKETKEARAALESGNALPSDKNEAWYSYRYPGMDGQSNTKDDMQTHFTKDGIIEQREIPSANRLKEAAAMIEHYYADHNTLPDTTTGQSLIESQRDLWNKPFTYRLLNGQSFRITSNGPDLKAYTKWDMSLIAKTTEAASTQETSRRKTWLDKRKAELGLTESNLNDGNTSTEDTADPFEQTFQVGGLTRLEGANYFWFFTALMTITALLFIPVSLRYKPTKLSS